LEENTKPILQGKDRRVRAGLTAASGSLFLTYVEADGRARRQRGKKVES